jgi:hypothetical protein
VAWSGFCVPQSEGSTCSVVTGATAILLDSQSAYVQEEVYASIVTGFNDTDLLGQFAPSVLRARFLTGLHQTLVVEPDAGSSSTTPGSVTATIAVAAASVSFLVASIFCYGLLRQEHRYHPEPHIRYKNRSIAAQRIGGTPMTMSKLSSTGSRRHFVRLDDVRLELVTSSPSRFAAVDHSTQPGKPEPMPSVAWSISDISSDCSSILSSLSRTTSKLERIEEEHDEGGGGHEEHAEYDDEGISMVDFRRRHFDIAMTVPPYFFGFDTSKGTKRSHVEKFDGGESLHDFEMEASDLEGCRYLDDSTDEQQESLRRVVTDVEAEEDTDENTIETEAHAMIGEFIGDLELSMETSRVDGDSICISLDSDAVEGGTVCAGIVSEGDMESSKAVTPASDLGAPLSIVSIGDGESVDQRVEYDMGSQVSQFDSESITKATNDRVAAGQNSMSAAQHSTQADLRENDASEELGTFETASFATPIQANGDDRHLDQTVEEDGLKSYGNPMQGPPQDEESKCHTKIEVRDEILQECKSETSDHVVVQEGRQDDLAAVDNGDNIQRPEDDILQEWVSEIMRDPR